MGIIRVNFDPALTRLLREVRYFKLLDLSVPLQAAEIYDQDEQFRQQIVSLDLLAGSYNEIITCLHPVEEPLIKDRIEKMDVALTPALDLLKWKSNDIDKFISVAKE
jgi:dynein heavy chain